MKVSNNNVDYNSDKYKSPGFWRTAGAVVAGGCTRGVIVCIGQVGSFSLSRNTYEHIPDKFKNPAYADRFIRQAIRNSGLDNVKIYDASKLEFKDLKNLLYDNVSKMYKNGFGRGAASSGAMHAKRDGGAYALLKTNGIILNKEKSPTSVFHEIGHLMNRNFSFIGKSLQKIRGTATFLPSLFLLTALIKSPKAPGEKPKNGFNKVTAFIKNHVGILTTAAFIPMVTEEAMATVKGIKLAKKVMSPASVKKIAATTIKLNATYLIMALFTGLAAFTAVKVRDAIAHPKPVKNA